jgi:hypothetical protein
MLVPVEYLHDAITRKEYENSYPTAGRSRRPGKRRHSPEEKGKANFFSTPHRFNGRFLMSVHSRVHQSNGRASWRVYLGFLLAELLGSVGPYYSTSSREANSRMLNSLRSSYAPLMYLRRMRLICIVASAEMGDASRT